MINWAKGTGRNGGFRGVGGFESSISQLCLVEHCNIDKRILYHVLSLTHPITNDCTHDTELPILIGK